MARKKNRRGNSSADNRGSFGQRVSIKPASNSSDNGFHMDRILCRAYSLDSNISDLSGSLGAHRPRGNSDVSNRDRDREDENMFMSILNDCATLTGIAEVVAEGQAALIGTTTDEQKSKRSSRKKISQPNVWGVSPDDIDDDSSDDSSMLKRKLEKEEEELVQHDNIELVLDDNFKTTPDPDTKSPHRPNLKNRVSSVLRRPSPVAGGENASSTNDGAGLSLLVENENADQGNTGNASNSVPTSQPSEDSASTASNQKKSTRKLFRFPKKSSKKSNSTKKNSSSSKAIAKQATAEQIEEAKNWKSTFDQTTGKAYYYNKKTKETVWEKPVGYDEACKELASSEEKEVASDLWKATVDQSTGKTYYYNKQTKEVSWTTPAGYKESVGSEKNEENNDDTNKADGDDSDISKYWRKTVDANTGKTYYFNKKTKMVSWKKPAGFVEKADAETVPLTKSQSEKSKNNYDTPFDEEPPDAPFDEPDGKPASPKKTHFVADKNTDETLDASLFTRTKSLKSIELTKQRTYASAMTDTTKKITNTGMPTRDFSNTQINVIKDDEDEESSQNSSLPRVSSKRGQPTPTNSSTSNDGKTPVVSPSTPKIRYRTKKAENLGSDDDSDFDDWSDEVSTLSGIGNEVNGVKSSRNKYPTDSRTVRSNSSHCINSSR